MNQFNGKVILILFIFTCKRLEAAHFPNCDTCFISFKKFIKLSDSALITHFSSNDTSIHLINYFKKRENRNKITGNVIYTSTFLFSGFSFLKSSKRFRNNDSSGKRFRRLGSVLLLLGISAGTFKAFQSFRYSNLFLYKELKYFYKNKQLSKRVLKMKIFDKKKEINIRA